jgi:uncharacterized protein (TIGR03437 family)
LYLSPVLASVFTMPSSGYAIAAHENFGSLITPDQPARAGEIIHLYAQGLGPVTPSVEDGNPAPSSPLSRTQNAVTCELSNGSLRTPADVLFSGLAPGLVGIYQLDVRLSEQLPGPVVACRTLGSQFNALIYVSQ